MLDLTKYFNSFPIHDSECDYIGDALLMLTKTDHKIISFKHEQDINISDYVLMTDENGNKYIDFPVSRHADAINNYYTDKDIKTEFVIKGICKDTIKLYKNQIDSCPKLSELLSPANTYHLSIMNQKIPLDKSDYIFLVMNYISQIYIRFTFNRETFNYNSFKFGYTAYVAERELRCSLVPVNDQTFYSGRIKYIQINDCLGNTLL